MKKYLLGVIVYLLLNLILFMIFSSRSTLRSMGILPEKAVPYILFFSVSIMASADFILFYFFKNSGSIRAVMRSKIALVALVVISAYYSWSILEGLLQYAASSLDYIKLSYILLPYNPFAFNFPFQSLQPPSLAHPFGTNYIGEDILTRILYATPSAAEISTVVVIFAVIVGSIIGIFAGYFGGIIDEILMRITDVFLAVPGLIIVIAISVILHPTYTSAMIGLMIPWWSTYARLFRSQTLVVKNMNYIDSARLSGLGNFGIIIKHVFHNTIDPIIAYAALDFGNVILTYSVLTFLGIGLQAPGYPEWGSMVSNGMDYLPQAWWYPLFPSLAILLIVSAFVVLGDRLQDVMAGRISY
ncbi:MAG: ABC transporter permease [Acidianus sp.]|nr:ABC transporter permease [Acidianus sp.]